MKKTVKSQLLAAISMMLVALVALIGATYAWFSLGQAPSVENLNFQARAASGVYLSTWGSKLTGNQTEGWYSSISRRGTVTRNYLDSIEMLQPWAFPTERNNTAEPNRKITLDDVSSAFTGTTGTGSVFYNLGTDNKYVQLDSVLPGNFTPTDINPSSLTYSKGIIDSNSTTDNPFTTTTLYENDTARGNDKGYAKFYLWVKSMTKNGRVYIDLNQSEIIPQNTANLNSYIKAGVRVGFSEVTNDSGVGDGGSITAENPLCVWEPFAETTVTSAGIASDNGATKVTNPVSGTGEDGAGAFSTRTPYKMQDSNKEIDISKVETKTIYNGGLLRILDVGASPASWQTKRIAVYVWLEGADTDVTDFVSAGQFDLKLQFSEITTSHPTIETIT